MRRIGEHAPQIVLHAHLMSIRMRSPSVRPSSFAMLRLICPDAPGSAAAAGAARMRACRRVSSAQLSAPVSAICARSKLRPVPLQRARQRVEIADHDRQHVVEVVRDAAGELADGFHLLRLEQLLLDAPAVGDVEAAAEDFLRVPVVIADQHRAIEERAMRAVGAHPAILGRTCRRSPGWPRLRRARARDPRDECAPATGPDPRRNARRESRSPAPCLSLTKRGPAEAALRAARCTARSAASARSRSGALRSAAAAARLRASPAGCADSLPAACARAAPGAALPRSSRYSSTSTAIFERRITGSTGLNT